jgi:hypothetical protein
MTGTNDTYQSTRTIANDWYKRSSTVAVGHYKAAERYARRHALLSAFSAVLSAVVGTAVFATLQQQPDPRIQIAVGLTSVVAAVLAVLSAGTGFQDKAEKHRIAGSKYNAVGRELEQLLTKKEIEEQSLTNVRSRLDALAQEMPHIPKSVHIELAHFPDIGKWGPPSLLARIRRYWSMESETPKY